MLGAAGISECSIPHTEAGEAELEAVHNVMILLLLLKV